MNIIAISNHIGASGSSVEKAFVMVVDTTMAGDAYPDNQYLLTTQAGDVFQGFDYTLKTSDGQEFNNLTGNILITFPSPGVYTLKISGKFAGVKNTSTSGVKIVDIKNWGDWQELQWKRCREGFRSCVNLTTFSASDAPYLGNIDSFGLRNMFLNCTSLNADFSKWDVSSVGDFDGFLNGCTVFNNPSLNNWDMSSATRLNYMFSNARAFNQDLSAWDVSNVITMTYMFTTALAFNGDVSTWNTSSLTGSLFTLFSRTSFNGDLSNWDVSGVTSLDNAFAYSPFNNNSISNWDVSNVSNFRATFVGTSFNQDLSNWDTGSAQSMQSMFSSSGFDNASIGNWNVSNVLDMAYMFYNCVFNKDISSWDVSSVTTMQGMFQDRNTKTNSAVNISGWTTSSLANTYQMFRGFGSNVQDLSNWDMSNVTDARGMFEFGGMTFDLSRWDIQGAVNLQGLLNQASNTSGVVGLWKFHNWNISQAVSITSMLGANVITTASYDAMLVAWAAQVPTTALNLNVNSTQYTLGGEVEAARTSLINTYGWTITDGGGVAEVPFVFDTIPFAAAGTVAIITQAGFTYDYNVSVSTGESFTNQTGDLVMTFGDNVTRTFTVSGLFPGFRCSDTAAARYQVITWGSQLWRTLAESFEHPNLTLTSLGSDVPNLNLCTSMYQTFKGVVNFPAVNNLADWYTGNVTTMYDCFRSGGGLNNVNLSSWDTSNVTDMRFMFSSNSSNWNLTPTDISQWNTKKVTTFQQMLYNNYTFNQPIQNWDVRSATGNAFQSFLFNATTNLGQFNQPLGLWNLNPSNYWSNFFRAMFYGQNAFDQDLSAWTITGLPNVTGNFNEFITNADLVARPMSFSRANYDKLLISWANQGFVFPEIISFGNAQYTLGGLAEAARNTLINTYGWTITDGGGIVAPFKFTIDTTLGDGLSEYEIRTRSDIQTYNYDITTSDGQSITGVTGNYNVIFSSPGIYDIEIRGTFPWLWGFGAPDRLKLTEVKEWGSQVWSSWEYMFYQSSNLTSITATDSPNLSSVTNMNQSFQQTSIGSPDFSSWDVSNVTSMASLFRSANFNGNVSTWDVSNVTNMAGTFGTAYFNSDITSWNVGNVNTFNECFINAAYFNQDISGWDTSSATSFRWMFYNAYQFNVDISGWNTSSLTNMELMFRYAIMFDQDISGWDINSVTTFNNLFLNTVGPSQANYDAILIGWEAQAPLTGKSINFGEATYTPGGAAEAARTSLINTYGWTITDGGSRTAQTSGFLLDDYPGAAAAYSFRQLSSSTPVVAQLSTSNSSTDFRDFTATEMQRRLHHALGYRSLRTFYDQSGNGRDADNGTMLLENGFVGLVDGYPVARTNAGFGTMFTPQQALSIDNSSIFFIGKITAAGHLFNYSSSTAPVGGGRLLYADQNLVNFSSASNDFSSNFTMNTTGLSLSYGVQNGQNVDLYHDAQTASGSMPSAVVTATNQYFGLTNVYPTSSGGPVNSAEFVFYPSDQSVNITGIRDNINEFYQL